VRKPIRGEKQYGRERETKREKAHVKKDPSAFVSLVTDMCAKKRSDRKWKLNDKGANKCGFESEFRLTWSKSLKSFWRWADLATTRLHRASHVGVIPSTRSDSQDSQDSSIVDHRRGAILKIRKIRLTLSMGAV